MAVYSILYENEILEAYTKAGFKKNIFGPLCKKALKEQGHVTCLKENDKSRKWGTIIPDGEDGVEILWEATERMIDGAYGN